MRFVFGIFVVATLATASLIAQDLTGDWHGTLKAGPAELRLGLHITKADGNLKATLDSVDQGANGIPVTAITLRDSTLKMTINAVHGTYEGKINAGANSIDGTWTQGQPLPLKFERGGFPATTHAAAKPSDIDGAWMGTLDTGAAKLRIIFHILNTADGLTATADSPDQGAKGMPVTAVTRNGTSLKLDMKALAALFDGTISADLRTITGIFTQGGSPLPLVLTRVKDAAELERRRPQNPTKPYPYSAEDVGYENKSQKVHLGATITIPKGDGPFPAVVLITGSGPQDRDESLMGHRPFLVLADYLTRRGVVVLRADDRGVGQSMGDFAKATSADFATDAEAGLAYLKTRPEVNPRKLGLIGHSEGGMIAPMIAARNPDVAYIVMMAGTGVRGDQLLPAQVAAILESSGKSHAEAEKAANEEREVLALSQRETDDSVVLKRLQELSPDKAAEMQMAGQMQQLRSPWFRYFMTYDPALALGKVTCPVLAINGEKDRQVIPEQNLPPIREALKAAGNTHFEVVELPGLNHLFQTATTGSLSEYAEIEETISPVALGKIADFVLKR